MDTITHALMPVIAVHSLFRGAKWLGRFGLPAIGLAGALPDILTPHLSLESRMASWSHGLPFWLAFTACVVFSTWVSKERMSLKLACAISAAYLLHLACDAISGGINWLYPAGDYIRGGYWVSPLLWIPLDVVCVLWCYYLFRLRPVLEKKRQAPRVNGNGAG